VILIDISKYELEIKRHVLLQALKRGIDPDIVEQAILKGKMERFGKHGVKFVNKGAKKTVICVGQIIRTKLKIFTIEESN
jgi:hypothetical protein